MSKTRIPIDYRHITVQGCTPERKRLAEEVQRALGYGVKIPECSDIEMLQDGSIRATMISDNGTVHVVDIYPDGEVTSFILCSPKDSFADTEDGTTRTCENYFNSARKVVSQSNIKNAQSILLRAKNQDGANNSDPIPPDSELAKR